MAGEELKIIVDVIAALTGVSIMANLVFFAVNLKLYTEIMKEKAQRSRQGGQ